MFAHLFGPTSVSGRPKLEDVSKRFQDWQLWYRDFVGGRVHCHTSSCNKLRDYPCLCRNIICQVDRGIYERSTKSLTRHSVWQQATQVACMKTSGRGGDLDWNSDGGRHLRRNRLRAPMPRAQGR